MTAPAAPSTAPSRVNPWVVMAFIALPVFIGSLDLTVVSAFLPELVVQLQLPFDRALDDAAWIVTGYLLAYTISLTFMGRVSDLIGRRAVYIVCLIIFIAGSLLVAVAHLGPTDLLFSLYRRMGYRTVEIQYVTLQVIIIGRVIQAIGAGALVPVSLALVADLFPAQRRAAALGLVGALDTLGWVLGHLYGGLLVQVMPWQGLFWINIPLSILALGGVLYALRHVPQVRGKGRFDFLGTALIVGALTALNVGLGANIEISGTANLDNLSPLPTYAAPVLLAGAVMFVLFIIVELRTRDPLINLRMFRQRNLSAASVVNVIIGYVLFIGLVSVPLLVNIRQESTADLQRAALEVGILLSALTVPMALAALPGGWLSQRVGVRNTLLIGLVLAAFGFFLKWQTWSESITNEFLALQMAIIGVGIGLTFSPVSAAIINTASDEERGVASALVIILRLLGMTISVSTLSTYGFYRVKVLVAEAQALPGFDPNMLTNISVHATLVVLEEMGLIGLVLCVVAILPTLLISSKEIKVDGGHLL